jgi:hypothetical protein
MCSGYCKQSWPSVVIFGDPVLQFLTSITQDQPAKKSCVSEVLWLPQVVWNKELVAKKVDLRITWNLFMYNHKKSESSPGYHLARA